MNRSFLLTTFCILLLAACNKRETVIENPEYDNSNTSGEFLISKIELLDSATVVYADIYGLPDWEVRISKQTTLRGDSVAYRVLRSEGIELSQQTVLPETGTITIKLFFEPLDKNEKIVDFQEYPDGHGWSVHGIKLFKVKHTEPVRCVIKGETVGLPKTSNLLMLLKMDNDERTAKIQYIPIRDGKFESTVYAEEEEAYNLVYCDEYWEGGWQRIDFILEPGTCNFTLYSFEEANKNTIKGGKYNDAYFAVTKKIKEEIEPVYEELSEKRKKLKEERKYYTEEFQKMLEEIERDKDKLKDNAFKAKYNRMRDDGTYLTPEAKALTEETKNIYKTMNIEKELDFAKQHVDIAGYTILLKNIRHAKGGFYYKDIDTAPMFTIFRELYENKFPNHPYTSLIRDMMLADSIKVGQPFPDISADDSDGNEVNISELIKGKVALIHLWASWCGPCRQHGMEMIPLYEKYKDKGFTVIGIAREQKKGSMEKAVERDKYPWVNLLELNDKHSIWTKLGVGGSGADFLIDADRNILAIKPSAEEVERILAEKTNR